MDSPFHYDKIDMISGEKYQISILLQYPLRVYK